MNNKELEKLKSYFKTKYKEDSDNQKKQSWDEYWNWIKRFYKGTFLTSGWFEERNNLLKNLNENVQTKIKNRLDELGKSIAAEWAKDNNIRKIDTTNVKIWAKKLRGAKKNDRRDGKELGKAIYEIETEINLKLKSTEN